MSLSDTPADILGEHLSNCWKTICKMICHDQHYPWVPRHRTKSTMDYESFANGQIDRHHSMTKNMSLKIPSFSVVDLQLSRYCLVELNFIFLCFKLARRFILDSHTIAGYHVISNIYQRKINYHVKN